MKMPHRLLSTLLLALCSIAAAAEQVNITITPKRAVLPPQVMLYISDPGQYFSISVQNPENEAQAVFFGAEIHQLTPSGGMDIVIPARTMPKQGIVVLAGQTRVLDAVQLRTLFNHVRQQDVEMPQGLFDNVMSGSFGMLAEGTYEMVLNAYKWDPSLSAPVLLSNPSLSRANFTVCYQAAAPRWVAPVPTGDYGDRSVATLSLQVPMLQWSSPAVSCNPTPIQYTYDLKIVQALPLQAPDEAMDRNPVVYQKQSLTMPQCLIPTTIIRNFAPTETYVAQITAHSDNTREGSLDFVNLQNNGRSDLLMFRVKDYTATPEPPVSVTPVQPAADDTDSIEIFGGVGKDGGSDSLYAFRNPEIISPAFAIADGARKVFGGEDIAVEWRKPWFRGGRGTQPDTLRIVYDVNLYAAHEYMAREEMIGREPVFTLKSLKATNDTIRWNDIKEKTGIGDYLLLRVAPRVVNEASVEFTDDSLNVVDFALTNRFTPNYFECSNGIEITNTRPTSLSAKDLQGKSVRIGEYELLLDGAELKATKKDGHFKGTGHVLWEPMKFTWKLAVKFDDIAINTDNEVYEGMVETFEGDKAEPIRGSETVNKLFSDWGIDNLIGDTGIPYADMLQQKVNGKVASLADELGAEIAPYYQDIKSGKAKAAGLLKGNLEDVTFPLSIPDAVNPLPVDLQISKMKFAPGYATMDFFGTYVVPETEATRNQILVFGAPRICISPRSLIPEGTTIALLKDFTIKDPRTDYDCTFKAPKDVVKPENGTYISWSNGRFETFRFEVDMTLPNLRKVAGDKATNECPQLHITADIKAPAGEGEKKLTGWDWYGTATLDPFEHEDLPGYTFHASDKVYIDHSARENVGGMPAFPKDYDLAKVGLQGSELSEWMGIYIGELSMEFPKDIKVGNGKERMKVSLSNMFIDKSGMTVEAGIVNAVNYKAGDNGTIGGFAFSLDEISVNFIQNQHKDFGFRGKLQIPLFKGTVNYDCRIYNQRFTQKGTKEGYAYVFKTYQLEGLSFDFMLGDLTLNKDLTYFLVEAMPDADGELKTNVELLLGGEVTIAGADKVNAKLSKLPIDLTLPGIRFCNLRVANNRAFESAYEPEMQLTAAKLTKQWAEEGKDDSGKEITWWNKAKDIELCGGRLFLNFGQWGYASPQKKIGPFNFALTKYDISLEGSDLAVTLGGDISFCEELNITAGTTISIYSAIKSLDDISNVSLEYKNIKFDEARIGVEVTGLKLNGVLTLSDSDEDKGYSGTLSVVVANGLFELDAAGGYFDHNDGDRRWSYGYFFASGKSKMGIPMGPISLTKLKGGLYFNCAFGGLDGKGNPQPPTPSKGAIGIIFGVGLATADGHMLSGDFDMAVCVMKSRKTSTYYLSTFNMTGNLTCLDGVINTRVTILYEDNDRDRFFQLNCTVDASADGAVKKYAQEIKEAAGALQQLTGKVQEQVADAKGGLSAAFGDKSDSKSGKDAGQAYKERTKNDSERSDSDVKATAGASASLDLRIQSRKNGEECSPVLWHVYLGQPDEDKRCKFILVDFKSKIVTVSVGASAYLCLGSELPDNGQLPPLPEKVARFLNGEQNGAAQSDSRSTADNARRKTLQEILAAAPTKGGVMLGASVWGYIDVDLGLFFGSMGATAGFDVSVVHLGNTATCVNLGPGTPGYNHWYGQGQLYAYLYAKFGFKINLGFFKKKVTLLDAGLGGVLRAQLPNPNYFEGKARCKIKLLGGLVKIDKKFSFTCGDGCDLFLGNALDNYQLFEDCNIATDKPDDMKDTKISWQLNAKPQIMTQGTIGKAVRVLDPTEENRIRGSKAGNDIEDFTAWASRSFRFVLADGSKPKLIEYNTYDDCKADRKAVSTTDVDYTVNGEKLVLALTQLGANRFYRLVVDGQAQEFRGGRWMHPETWDSIKGKYVETPWRQRKVYYFATDDSRSRFTNVDELESFTKVAFPMAGESRKEGRVIVRTDKYVDAPTVDIRRPMISLSQRTKTDFTSNNKGQLVWMLCPEGKESYQTGAGESDYLRRPGDCFYRQPNRWIENDSVSILTPAADFPVTASFRKGVIKLVYEWQETVSDLGEWKLMRSYNVSSTQGEAAVRANAIKALATGNATGTARLRSKPQYRVEVVRADELTATDDNRQWNYRVNIYRFEKGSHIVTFGKELYSVPVSRQSLGEERPDRYISLAQRNGSMYYWADYCATRLDDISIENNIGMGVDMRMRKVADAVLIGGTDKSSPFLGWGKATAVTNDAVAYLSYMSNLFLIGGYRIKSNPDYLNIDITTSESLRMSTPFTAGFVQGGVLKSGGYQYQVYDAYPVLLKDLIMGPWTGRRIGNAYPLFDAGDERLGAIVYAPGVQKTADGYMEQIRNLYVACSDLSARLAKYMNEGHYWNKKSWRDWLSKHKSPAYINVTIGSEQNMTRYSLEVPYYQIPVIFRTRAGSDQLNNIVYADNDGSKHWRIDKKHDNNLRMKLLWGAYRMTKEAGKEGFQTVVGKGMFQSDDALRRIRSIRYTRYRVNAWNFKTLNFTVYSGSEANTTNGFFLKSEMVERPFKN